MTCDHPECTDDAPKTYTDEHDNGLELCEAHYYYLVSGKKPSTLRPDRTPLFDPAGPAERASGFLDDLGEDSPRGRQREFDPKP